MISGLDLSRLTLILVVLTLPAESLALNVMLYAPSDSFDVFAVLLRPPEDCVVLFEILYFEELISVTASEDSALTLKFDLTKLLFEGLRISKDGFSESIITSTVLFLRFSL